MAGITAGVEDAAGAAARPAPVRTTPPVPTPRGLATTPAVCSPTTGWARRTIDVGGGSRSYLLAVPSAPAVASRAPVLLAFHGYSSTPTALAAASQLGPAMTAHGFVVVLPEGIGSPPRWALPDRLRGADDDGFVEALLRDLALRGCGDPTRLYAAGFSNGAAYVGHLACRRPERFRGLAFVGGAGLVGACAPGRTPPTTPVLLVHGRADPIVPIAGGPVLGGTLQAEPFVRAVARWRQLPGRAVVVRIVPRLGHRWPSLATEEIVATFAS